MRILFLMSVVLIATNSIATAQFTRALDNKNFDLVRDVYLAGDLNFGETDVLLQMFVAISRNSDEPKSEFSQLASEYSKRIEQLRDKFNLESDPNQLELIRQELEACKLEACDHLAELVDRRELLLEVQRKNVAYFEKRNQIGASFDVTFLTNPKLSDSLKLTAKQKERLEREHRKIADYQNKLWDEFGPAYDNLSERALNDINSILDDDQRKEFKKLVGTPINWARLIEQFDSFEYFFRVSDPNANFVGVGLNRGIGDDDRPAIDVFLFTLLRADFLRKELDLSADQKQKLVTTLDDYQVSRVIDESRSNDRFDELLADKTADFPKEVADILLGHQEDTLRQIELQFRTGAYRFSFGALHPRLVEKLELTRRQQNRIEEISTRFEGELIAFSDEAKIQFAKLMRSRYLNTMTVLDDEQLRRYSLLTGVDTSTIGAK